ncbi:MAG: hypothetical protein AAF993_18850 [Pseudomonadota bacterium]
MGEALMQPMLQDEPEQADDGYERAARLLLQSWGESSRGGHGNGMYKKQPFHVQAVRRDSFDHAGDRALIPETPQQIDAVERAWVQLRHRSWQTAEVIRCIFVYGWTIRQVCLKRPGLKMKPSKASSVHGEGIAYIAALCEPYLDLPTRG